MDEASPFYHTSSLCVHSFVLLPMACKPFTAVLQMQPLVDSATLAFLLIGQGSRQQLHSKAHAASDHCNFRGCHFQEPKLCEDAQGAYEGSSVCACEYVRVCFVHVFVCVRVCCVVCVLRMCVYVCVYVQGEQMLSNTSVSPDLPKCRASIKVLSLTMLWHDEVVAVCVCERCIFHGRVAGIHVDGVAVFLGGTAYHQGSERHWFCT